MMHVGFDISQTGTTKAGCGFFAHSLLSSFLRTDTNACFTLYPIFGDFYYDGKMKYRQPYSGPNVSYGPRWLSRDSAADFWGSGDIEAVLKNPDVVHANNFWCPIQLTSSRLVYTLYDLSFALEPSWATETNRTGCFEGIFRASIAADWILAISEFSRVHFLSTFPHFPENRVRVIHPCSRFRNLESPGKRPGKLEKIGSKMFWLSVGTIEPRKNYFLLAEAYARYLSKDGAPYPLVLAGGVGWLMEDFEQHLKKLGIADHVVLTGYVSDKELIWLYRNCYAHLYPSLFEGFGLPVLEGMQFGAATLASDTSSIPEVAGDAAILIDPDDSDQWAEEMLQLSRQPERRNRMRTASWNQAERFSWEKSASSTLELYREAVSNPKRLFPIC